MIESVTRVRMSNVNLVVDQGVEPLYPLSIHVNTLTLVDGFYVENRRPIPSAYSSDWLTVKNIEIFTFHHARVYKWSFVLQVRHRYRFPHDFWSHSPHGHSFTSEELTCWMSADFEQLLKLYWHPYSCLSCSDAFTCQNWTRYAALQ